MRLLVLGLFAAFSCSLAGCGGAEGENGDADDKTIYFSAIPDDGSADLRAKFDKVAAALSEALEVPVKYKPSSKYSFTVQAFKNGDVQFAWFGGLTGCQARAAIPGARAIVQGDADPNFRTYFVAHKDTGLTKSDEFPMALKGLTFTFGSERSTSGRLMPEFHIRKATGMAPDKFFKSVGYSGAHDKTAKAVESGSVQAGALNFKTYDKMVREGKLDPDVCRIVWITPGYADYNLTVHPDLDKTHGAGFIDKLQKALCALPTSVIEPAMNRNKLIPAKNEDFQMIVDTAKSLDLLR